MKTALYVAAVARTYRMAIDDYFASPDRYRERLLWYREEIVKCTYRKFTTGFFYGKPDREAQVYDDNTYINEYVYLGIVEEVLPDGSCRITQRNKFAVGDEVELMCPDGRNVPVRVLAMRTINGESVSSCPHPQQVLYLTLSEEASQYDLLRVQKGGV